MATLRVFPDRADGNRYGVDQTGRVTATRVFLVKVEGGQELSDPQRIALILNDSRIPRYNDLLFYNSAPPSMYAVATPRVMSIEVTLLNNEPNTYKCEIQYGYSDNNSSSGGTPEEDAPDQTRERFPWEYDAEVNVNFGNGKEEIPEYAGFMGTKSLAEVVAERGKSTAIEGSVSNRFMMNTAKDLFQNPPTKILHAANITVSFNKLKSDKWSMVRALPSYLFKVANTPISITIDGVQLESFPAGTVMFMGFDTQPSTYTYNRTWKRGKIHPFEPSKGYNHTKFDITVYKYYSYTKYTLTFEHQPRGYIKYVANVGFRQLQMVAEPNVEKQFPILQPDTQPITEPARLYPSGYAVPIENPVTDSWFQKYKYYDDGSFTPLLSAIPWEYK